MSDEKVWETPWQPPHPTELPDLRAELAQQTQTGFELHSTAAVLKEGRGSIVPHAESAEESARVLLEEERQRLASSELYFASPEMTRLAVTAAESLPEFHLEPEDVPAPTGLIVFGEPIGSYTNTESGFPMRLPIVAVCWGQWSPDGRWERGTGVWLSFYAPQTFPPSNASPTTTVYLRRSGSGSVRRVPRCRGTTKCSSPMAVTGRPTSVPARAMTPTRTPSPRGGRRCARPGCR